MKRKLTVTVGMPAYNEEVNISQLLKSILEQFEANYTLEKIIVVSDQSTDRTDEIVKSFKSQKIKLIRNKIRLGQALSQNEITKICSSEILILMNADMHISDNHFISKLITPFQNEKNVGITCPQLEPLPAKTYFERILNYSVNFKNTVFEKINSGNNMYTCRGACRAFSRKFYKKFEWPKLTAEDTYTYLFCLKKNFQYRFCPVALIHYRSPGNFTDHLKQSKRFSSHKTDLERFFGTNFVSEQYRLPLNTLLQALLIYLLLNPLLMGSYIFISILVFLSNYNLQGPIWEPASSTKA